MANAFYDSFLENCLGTGTNIDFDADTIKVALVDTGTYTVNLATHDFYDDVSGVVGTPATLASKTVTDGTFDAANVTYTSVTGNTVEALVVYKDTGTPSTSDLIAYFDTGTGFPVTPNGGDITITWGANIFAL